MKGISKNTSIVLIVVLIFGVIIAGIFGFMSGMKFANAEQKKNDISNKVTKKEEKVKEKDIILEVTATSDIEFITDIRNTYEKFSKSECNIYIVNYKDFIFTASGKNFVGVDGYNIEDISIVYKDKRINKKLEYGTKNLGYSNNISSTFMQDGTNTLYSVIINISNDSNQPSSYIISFNQNGEVLLNEENSNYYYSIVSNVENNIEVKSIISIFALGNYVYGDDFLNKCSDNYLNMIKDYPDETIVYSKKVYTYSNNTLSVTFEDTRTIAQDKVQKAC